MFRNILVPVDFTPKNRRAIATALQAGGPRARLTLLHVVEKIGLIPPRELRDFYEDPTRPPSSRLAPSCW